MEIDKDHLKHIDEILSLSLTSDQRFVLERNNNNTCILATAGSGKTRSVVHSILYDLAHGIRPNQIIAFTFTEKAANELFVRTYELAGSILGLGNLQGISIGTIHAWCHKHLTSHSSFSTFSSVDDLHLEALVGRLYDSLNISATYGSSYPQGIDRFLRDLEVYYNEQLQPSEVPERIRKPIELFISILNRERLLSYGGMVREAIGLLEREGPIADLKRLYVDEYQDVNPAQVELVRKMLPAHSELVVVGDDLQSIYNWRGSDVSRIINFEGDFSPADIIRLDTNHRSLPGIVDVCNNIGQRIKLRDTKKVMKAARQSENELEVLLVSGEDESAQAVDIAESVQQFRKAGVGYREIAILLRSVRLSGPKIVEAFDRLAIPYVSPTLSRGGAFINSFLVPITHFIGVFNSEAKNEREEIEAEEYINKFQRLLRPWFSDENQQKTFLRAIGDLKRRVDSRDESTYDVRGCLYSTFDKCGVGVDEEDDDLMLALGIASQIIRTVEEAHRRRISGEQRKPPIGVWLEVYHALRRQSTEYGESIPLAAVSDRVMIITVHQAKGLQWPIVIVPSLQKGLFPVRSRKYDCSYSDGIADRYGTSDDDERRLFYVATTRAQDRLLMMAFSGNDDTTKSPFFLELAHRGTMSFTNTKDIPPGFWNPPKKTAQPPSESAQKIGLSDLLIYLDCPFQFGLRRLINIEPAIRDDLGFGKGVHALLQERHESSSNWSADETKERALRCIFLPYMSEADEIKARSAAAERLLQLQKLRAFDDSVATEISVEVPLSSGLVSGTIDLVKKNGDGSVSLLDWKSNISATFLGRYEKQIQFYAHALILQGVLVREAVLIDIGASYDRKELVSQNVDVSPNAIRALIESLETAMEGIVSSRFSPTASSPICSSCDMMKICSERVITV